MNINSNEYGFREYIESRYNLIMEIDKWSKKYQFNIQAWGSGKNNIYIYKDDVELFCGGEYDNLSIAIIKGLQYIYRINRVPYNKRIC